MTPHTFARLGRVSNLPTVWTNGLAGWVIAGGVMATDTVLGPADVFGWRFAVLLVALSLFYVGGMFLNDAFDAEIDARERANRPIPSGEISRRLVYILGFALLATAIVLCFGLGAAAGVAGLALGAAVVLYDWLHKRTPFSPLLMGACRFLSYAVAALAVGAIDGTLAIAATGLFCHVVGLTYAARQEAYDRIGRAWPLAVLAIPAVIGAGFALGAPAAMVLLAGYLGWCGWALHLLFRRRPGDVPRAVVALIAGVALYDAVLIAGLGSLGLALAALGGFGATLLLQRVAPGT